MRVRFRAEEIRRSLSFSTSGVVHGVLLALVAFGGPAREEKPQSLYDTAIRPQEKRIVWYQLQDKLPDVRPAAAAKSSSLPLRATRKFEQRIVAGAKDDARAPQLVWSPAPEVAAPKMTPLPNVLAVEMKRLSPPFAAPRVPAPAVAPKLPDAAPAPSTLAAAPAGPNLAALKKTFTRPELAAPIATPRLPDAAPAPSTLAAAPAGPNLASLKKTFKAPTTAAPGATATLPDAAPAPTTLAAAPAGPNLASLKKTFTPPTAVKPTAPPLDPDLPAADTPQLAIIGLNPAKLPDLAAPPDSRSAGFSAGPTPHPKGAETDGNAAGVAVPGVTVRDGITRQQLLANIRPMAHIPTGPPPSPPPTRVSTAPDPALDGRTVYTMAIQMPNITSYSGSWMVWYAAREQVTGAMRPPSPLRKVDPKYIASAVADGVEGVVRLGATIRKDGRIEAVRLLRHLDDRLDRSAMEALAKWEFEPARRDAAAVDVDAVFEIPFRLAPKTSK